MNIKSLALAVGIAASTFSVSSASAGILDDLDLTYLEDGQFSTGISSADDFWGEFKKIFFANNFQLVLDGFRGLAADFDDYEWNQVGFNSTTLAPWSGLLNFSIPTSAVTFTSSNIINGEFSPNPTVSVPGPEAGAGLGALAMAGVAYFAMRRRKQHLAA